MTVRGSTVTLTVPLSGTISNGIGLANAKALAIFAPAITSGHVFLQAGPSPTTLSADMVPLFSATTISSAHGPRWAWAAGAGAAAISIDDTIAGVPFLRLQLENPQAAARNFTLYVTH